MPDQVVIQRPFLHDLAAGQVDENGILFHAAKLGGPDQAASGSGERRTDQQNVSRLQEIVQPFRRSDPVYSRSCEAMPVDGVHPHADAVHQPGGRGSDAAQAKDSAEPACQHAGPRELIELAVLEAFVFQNQALGSGKRHGEGVLSHRTRHSRRRWSLLARPPGVHPTE